MRKISLSLLFSLLIVSLIAGVPSGYIPFHQVLLNKLGDIQKASNARNIQYEEIAYSHNVFLSNAGTWTPSDSALFTFSQSASVVYETGGTYYKFINPSWVVSATDSNTINPNGTLSSSVGKNVNSSTAVNSYQYTCSYYTTAPIGYLQSETLQTWNGSAWVDSTQYSYTYDSLGRIATLNFQNGSALANDSQYIYTYNGYNNTQVITQYWSGLAWVNAFRQSNSFDANGNNYQRQEVPGLLMP